MSRSRKIEPDDILDATERVILRAGAAGLSIDGVAKEIGVSKSNVVYHHKSKSALLEALVERQIAKDKCRIAASIAQSKDTPHPELYGRIASAEQDVRDAERVVAMAISVSLANEDRLQEIMREWTRSDLVAIKGGARPEAALMAYLALSGFYCIELFAFHSWSKGERQSLLDNIRKIYLSFPEA